MAYSCYVFIRDYKLIELICVFLVKTQLNNAINILVFIQLTTHFHHHKIYPSTVTSVVFWWSLLQGLPQENGSRLKELLKGYKSHNNCRYWKTVTISPPSLWAVPHPMLWKTLLCIFEGYVSIKGILNLKDYWRYIYSMI